MITRFSRTFLSIAAFLVLATSGSLAVMTLFPGQAAAACSGNPTDCTTRDECISNGGAWLSEERQHCVPMSEASCKASGGTWERLSGCSDGGSTKSNSPGTTTGTPSSQCSQSKKKSVNFFRMPTWYQYLEYDPQTCDVKFCVLGNGDNGCDKSSIPLVLLALIDIGLRIGALVAVGFVVYGGIKFVTSQGEPDEVKGARNTILNALIGLVIAMIATPMVVFLGTRLGA